MVQHGRLKCVGKLSWAFPILKWFFSISLHWLWPLCVADVDECFNQDICGIGGRCVNLPGSYKCECHSGFRSKSHRSPACEGKKTQVIVTLCILEHRPPTDTAPTMCVSFSTSFSDINECLNPDTCPNEQCENTPGSYECVPCLPGHEARAGICYGKCSSAIQQNWSLVAFYHYTKTLRKPKPAEIETQKKAWHSFSAL